MDRHEYRRQNERRDACRDKKLAEESHATKRWWQLRPTWWNIPSDRFAFFVAVFTGVLALVAIWQWSAMRQADQTTRESFSAVQRPFITAIGLNFSQQGYGASTPQYWLFQTVLENSGNTPTKNMTVTLFVSFDTPIVPNSPPDPADLKKDDETLPMITDYFIGPHGKIPVDAIALHFKTMEEMAQSRLTFFIYGIARYYDQFSNTPRTCD